jgi:iron complex transport system substrate-binding protein
MSWTGRDANDITKAIVDSAYKLHCALGPGMAETVYELVLTKELERRGLRADRQVPISINYDGIQLENVCRADIVVEQRVILEIKSVERLAPVHPKQLLTYLRLMNLRIGLLINFGAATFKEGIRRVAN